MMKSHFSYRTEYKNVIYIVRDPRDVATSYYFHTKKFDKINKEETFNSFLRRFNTGKLNFGIWNEHVNSWLNNQPTNFLLIKYEDIVRDTFGEMEKVFRFLGITFGKKKLENSINKSSFESMLNIEKKLTDSEPLLQSSNTDMHFVRKGIIGDYKIYFSKNLEREFINIHFNAMQRLGYIY